MAHDLRGILAGLALAAALAGAAFVLLDGTAERRSQIGAAMAQSGGDPARAPVLFRAYGCGACHEIAGVAGARGKVGPPLGLAGRLYIGSSLPNDREQLVAWIQHPRRLDPRTAMPELGVAEQEARDMAAYLLTRN